MGLRPDGEKPAAVLWLVYVVGWLPALICANAVRTAAGAGGVLTAAGNAGVSAGLGLAGSLVILSGAYVVAIRRPPAARELIMACAGSLLAVLAMPVLFSADTTAYAYYGDLALHGRNPWAHGPAPAGDPLAELAVAAWNGHVPPRCVYGPVAVAIAAIADVAGAAAGVAGQIAAQRIAAAAAYACFVMYVLALVGDRRARAVFVLNPVVLWSVAEGHNDAAMLALAAAGIAAGRTRPLLFALAALVKAPALLVLERLGSVRAAVPAVAFVVLGYVPLAIAVLADRSNVVTGAATNAWESPLGLLAALVGRLPAAIIAVFLLVGAAFGARRLAADRAAAFALAAWFALPNAYPWYALWIVPLAARNVTSLWSRALLVASLFAPTRAVIDAIFRSPERETGMPTLHVALIALQFLPPLVVLGFAGLRRRTATALLTIALVVGYGLPALAQSTAPSPLPAAPPATPTPTPTPGQPAGIPVPQPQAAPSAATETPGPTTSPTPGPILSAPPLPVPVITALPAPATPVAPVTTPNPFGYIITPTPVPATNPDGPHILEVQLNDRRIRAGGPLLVRVITSDNVVGVEARALGRFIPIPQSSPGLFALAYTMPGAIPFWLLNRNYDIVIAAATADGRQTSVSFPMLLTR